MSVQSRVSNMRWWAEIIAGTRKYEGSLPPGNMLAVNHKVIAFSLFIALLVTSVFFVIAIQERVSPLQRITRILLLITTVLAAVAVERYLLTAIALGI